MSLVEIRDYALWGKHIYGNEELKNELLEMKAGELIELEIDGFKGMWLKMSDGKDGRPTPGIKGIGEARKHWHSLQDKRGKLVSIKKA